jgi:hypothetical protein
MRMSLDDDDLKIAVIVVVAKAPTRQNGQWPPRHKKSQTILVL